MEVTINDLRFSNAHGTLLSIPEWSLKSGETYLLSGPTGCGKSTLAKWMTGWDVDYVKVQLSGGEVGKDHYSSESEFRQNFTEQFRPLYLLQDAYTIFNPYVSIGRHFRDIWQHQKNKTHFKEFDEVLDFLRKTGIDPDSSFLRRKAHQISQGEAQRCAFVMSLIRPSVLLILDEILSNVDRQASEQMMNVLQEWQKRTGLTALFISHDVDFLSPYAAESFTIRDGILSPVDHKPIALRKDKIQPENRPPLIYFKNLKVLVPGRISSSKKQEILWTLPEFYCYENESLGISGISGIGKTTFLLGLMGIRSLKWEEFQIKGASLSSMKEVNGNSLDIRYLLQSVTSGFNPAQNIKRSLKEIQKVHRLDDQAVQSLLSDLRLHPELMEHYPGEVSGGEIQRFGVLTMLMGNPDLILFDESFASVDVETRHAIWEVISEKQKEKKFAIITVSHDVDWLETEMDRCIHMK